MKIVYHIAAVFATVAFFAAFSENPSYICEEVMRLQSEITVALLSLAGTLLGSLGGILASSKLTAYRLSQLEKKVDRHNGFGERIPVLEEKLKVVNHRLDDLEGVMNR